jgi:hypothetical protein
MGADKSHKKKKTNKKVLKKIYEKKNKEEVKEGNGGNKVLTQEAARKQNPKAFVFSSRGKAKRNQARTAEKDQRRMHGQSPPRLHVCTVCLVCSRRERLIWHVCQRNVVERRLCGFKVFLPPLFRGLSSRSCFPRIATGHRLEGS